MFLGMVEDNANEEKVARPKRRPGGARNLYKRPFLPQFLHLTFLTKFLFQMIVEASSQGGEAHLRWVAPAPSVGCSCHYISEMKLKSEKRPTSRHPMVNLLSFLLHKFFLVYMSKF